MYITVASFRTRKTAVANGLFMGKFSYLICVWGGTAKKVLQNRVHRFVTRNWEAALNLKTVGWLRLF